MLAQVTTPNIDLKGPDRVDRLPSLEQVRDRLDIAITSAQVARVLVEGGIASANAASGALVLLSNDRRELRVAFSVGDVTGRIASEGRLPLTARFPLSEVVRSRQELWLNSPDQLAERYPETVPLDNSRAWAALPLFVAGVLLGAVGWSFRRQWLTSDQRACLRSLARAGGAALYRAGLFDSERLARMRAECAQFEAERRDRLMADVSFMLDSATATASSTKLLDKVARRALPVLGEWYAVHILDEDGRLRQVAAGHVYAAKERLLLDASQASAGLKLPSVLNNGKPVLIQSIGDGVGNDSGLQRHQLHALRTLGLERLLVVPLRVYGHTLGTLCFARLYTAPTYSVGDQALAQRVARRCAALLEYGRLREAAQHADNAREDFVAATSHELRTPLSHIKGFVSTLRMADTVWDAPTRDDFLAEIEHEADRLARLVENLLDMSRIDSGGLDSSGQAPTAPAALVQAGIDRVRASLGERQLEIQVPNDLPPVWVDASQVERVVANLLDNAAKYSPPTEPIGVVGKLADGMVMFRIQDRGLGIPSEHLERIFEPFFREPTGAYPAKPGTGLGLAICRRIVRSQKGQVWAEQRLGGGTNLVFTLPIVGSHKGR